MHSCLVPVPGWKLEDFNLGRLAFHYPASFIPTVHCVIPLEGFRELRYFDRAAWLCWFGLRSDDP